MSKYLTVAASVAVLAFGASLFVASTTTRTLSPDCSIAATDQAINAYGKLRQ
jgi:hypothetical protein